MSVSPRAPKPFSAPEGAHSAINLAQCHSAVARCAPSGSSGSGSALSRVAGFRIRNRKRCSGQARPFAYARRARREEKSSFAQPATAKPKELLARRRRRDPRAAVSRELAGTLRVGGRRKARVLAIHRQRRRRRSVRVPSLRSRSAHRGRAQGGKQSHERAC